MRTNMDVLVLGNQILLKEEQPPLVEDFDWRERYELD
jgi:carbamoyltransferase